MRAWLSSLVRPRAPYDGSSPSRLRCERVADLDGRCQGGGTAAIYSWTMPPRFDPEHRTLDLSVADLLDAPLFRSLGFASRGGFERLWLGQAIHGRYQESALAADATYRREVVVVHSFEHRGWRVTVQGRADGLRREPDGALVVEEIKSVRRGTVLAPAIRESYQRQALLYAWMLAQGEAGPVRAELVLISIGSDETEREPLEIEIGRASCRERV